jgi:para-aminobenzoate synthetase component 1
MQIIDRLEPVSRGLSMGAIGVSLPAGMIGDRPVIETSVAIRTATFHGGRAEFNVGGGVTIDSDPESEYEESWLKAKAILRGLGSRRARTEAGDGPI